MLSPLALVDADNFYTSAESAFNPRLAGRPVVVLSNNDGNVIARSKEAKALGIKMAQPLFQVRGLLEAHDAAILSSNYELYADLSLRFQTLLYDYSPDIEHYSADEVWMKMPLSRRSLTETGHEMRDTIQALTGLPVSVGFAETKTLAKVAIEFAKTSARTGGVLDLTRSPYQSEALSRLPVGKVWGIGRQYAALLEQSGIKTARQFRDADDRWVRQQLTVVGARTQKELRGIPCIPLEPTPKTKQQLCYSRSFGQATESLTELRAAVAHFTTRVAEKLREHGLVAGELSVFVMTDRHKDSPQYANSSTLSIAPMSNSTLELLPLALRGLAQIYRAGFAIRKAGVLLNGLELAERAPRPLWDEAIRDLHARLLAAVDALNARFGTDTVRCGLYPSAGIWQTRAAWRSPAYTTQWSDIMVAT